MWESIIVAALGILSSVLAFVFKKYWAGKDAAAAAEKQAVADEQKHEIDSAAFAAREQAVNQTIDGEAQAAIAWADKIRQESDGLGGGS